MAFSSAGSTDPYGRPLTDSWDFGDGSAPSTAPTPPTSTATTGNYTATLTVSNGTQSVVDHHQGRRWDRRPPSASITAPSTYNAGDTVTFSGTATDPVDGTLPASDYTWQVDFYTNGVLAALLLRRGGPARSTGR